MAGHLASKIVSSEKLLFRNDRFYSSNQYLNKAYTFMNSYILSVNNISNEK